LLLDADDADDDAGTAAAALAFLGAAFFTGFTGFPAALELAAILEMDCAASVAALRFGGMRERQVRVWEAKTDCLLFCERVFFVGFQSLT
jgi:hypothetical protein